MTINEERQLGRAKNATMAFLERRLSIPKIYVDALWDGHKVDVLAIDRDGVGDVHAVLFFSCKYSKDNILDTADMMYTIHSLLEKFSMIPAQYKYIGVVDPHIVVLDTGLTLPPKFNFRKITDIGIPADLLEKSFSKDGMGRVGFLTIEADIEGDLKANVEIKPERFRAKIAKLADDYVQQHEADWEIRA